MLDVNQISVRLAGRDVLSGASFRLEPGRFAIVVGPNGAGKTTLMRALTGDLEPHSGDVRFEGRPLRDWRGRDLARRRAVLSQASHLAFPFSVHEVVALGLRAGGTVKRDLPGTVVNALARVGLDGYEGRFYQQLSGGEQQRVHLARVLCQIGRPVDNGAANWLFLDEPTSSLDIRHQFQILDLARDHVRAGGGGLAILHDLNMAGQYADRLIVVGAGRIVADGPPAQVLTDRFVEDVFGVSADRFLMRHLHGGLD